MVKEELTSPFDELIEKLKTEIPEERFKEPYNTSDSFRELFEEVEEIDLDNRLAKKLKSLATELYHEPCYRDEDNPEAPLFLTIKEIGRLYELLGKNPDLLYYNY